MLATQEMKRMINRGGNQTLSATVRPQLEALTQFMEGQINLFEEEIRDIVRYCIENQGKRLRPKLTFLAGLTNSHASTTDLVRAAAVVELVHLATLVHDDILDDAALRHNSDTVSAKYGAHTAVLLGDALFAQALHLASDFPTVEICRAVSFATRRVCSGEIKQTFERGNIDLSIENYFKVIDYKTAELFRVSCYLGAKLAGYEPSFVEACSAFGRHLGIAYQIFDDVADYLGDEAKIGKTLGTDLESGKFTLPILLLFRALGDQERAALAAKIKDNSIAVGEISQLLTTCQIREAASDYLFMELVAAEKALQSFQDHPPVPHLLQLIAYVAQQAQKLGT